MCLKYTVYIRSRVLCFLLGCYHRALQSDYASLYADCDGVWCYPLAAVAWRPEGVTLRGFIGVNLGLPLILLALVPWAVLLMILVRPSAMDALTSNLDNFSRPDR